MKQTCENCMNAYNSPHSSAVLCWNKDFLAQFDDLDTKVLMGETCGTWQARKDTQGKLVFGQAIQLTLFEN